MTAAFSCTKCCSLLSLGYIETAQMRDHEICKGVLERLLQIKIDHIAYPELQKSISPLYTQKGVRLDVYVADSDRVFDVECQSYKIENIGKRTRYYQSLLDIDSLFKGSDYSELKESYVIFICTDDPFDKNLPVYTFERKCKENADVDLEDMTHHIVFNAAAYGEEDNPEIKDFLSFVKNNQAKSDFTRRISNYGTGKEI
ncbi:MAG: Rpn family recombination-promoting nuclease/putative transposase [Treponema sp.]|nr:Rpn family recombination-promoting nuclease/putative transposase [Treponema sp.]